LSCTALTLNARVRVLSNDAGSDGKAQLSNIATPHWQCRPPRLGATASCSQCIITGSFYFKPDKVTDALAASIAQKPGPRHGEQADSSYSKDLL